jgi:hypothetical protein
MIRNEKRRKDNFDGKEKKVIEVPDGGLTPGHTGRQTVGRKINSVFDSFLKL